MNWITLHAVLDARSFHRHQVSLVPLVIWRFAVVKWHFFRFFFVIRLGGAHKPSEKGIFLIMTLPKKVKVRSHGPCLADSSVKFCDFPWQTVDLPGITMFYVPGWRIAQIIPPCTRHKCVCVCKYIYIYILIFIFISDFTCVYNYCILSSYVQRSRNIRSAL